jgi:hypothetical protein
MAIPQQPEMTAGGSTIQLCSDFQSWLLWAKEYHPTAPPEIRAEAERRAQLCGVSLDDNTKTDNVKAKTMAKTKKKPEIQTKDKDALYVTCPSTDFQDEVLSKLLINPVTQAAFTLRDRDNRHSLNGLHKALGEQINEVVAGGSMARPESMLLCQAHTLDVLFNNLAYKAHNQTYIPNYETFLRLALKAQAQCRSTLETLAAIKNPPVIFAKQANISQGHQQINNNVPRQAPRAEENKNLQNELLTELPNETLDTGRTEAASPVNSHLAALE